MILYKQKSGNLLIICAIIICLFNSRSVAVNLLSILVSYKAEFYLYLITNESLLYVAYDASTNEQIMKPTDYLLIWDWDWSSSGFIVVCIRFNSEMSMISQLFGLIALVISLQQPSS